MDFIDSKHRKSDLANERPIVEVKQHLSAARDMHDAIVTLAVTLSIRPVVRGYLLLVDPGMSKTFIEQKVKKILVALRPDISDRLNVIVSKGGEIEWETQRIRQEDIEILNQTIHRKPDLRVALQSPCKQDEVFLVILYAWIIGRGPVTSQWLQETVGCNYRTAAMAIDRIDKAIRRYSDRRISLKYFPEQDWQRLLAVVHKTRSTMLFADASGQARSSESLLRRVTKLNRKDIAVGGVTGAKNYFGDLDIVGIPRLDLCVHIPGKNVDLDFVKKLDPGLTRTSDSHQPARLALHFIRRKKSLFSSGIDSLLIADPIECLLELWGARLNEQARAFQEFLEMREKELNHES